MEIKNAELEWQASTPVNKHFKDPYFSLANGLAETNYVFIQHNGLPGKWKNYQDFVIAETGFGTGLNFVATAQQWADNRNNDSHLTYYSIEKYPLSYLDLTKSLENWPQFKTISQTLITLYPDNLPGFHQLEFTHEKITLVLMFGDVLPMLKNMQCKVDCWYLDGFSPGKNPDMWSMTVCEALALLSHENTSFATFTAASIVRRNLQAVGFDVKKMPGFGKKREMLCGHFVRQCVTIKNTKPWFSLEKIPSKLVKEVTIIGGGLAGLTCAWMLSQEGVNCTLIESADSLASGASGNAAGIVMPRFSLDLNLESQFYLSSFLFSIACLNRLKKENEDLCWEQSGVLQFVSQKRMTRIKELGFSEFFLQYFNQTLASIKADIPLTQGGIYFPKAGYVNMRQLCEVLKRVSESTSTLTIKSQTRVKSCVKQDDCWWLYDAEDQCVSKSEIVIFANGFDAENLLPRTQLKLSKSRGQISQVVTQDDLGGLKFPICHEGYIIPEIEGNHVIGATYRLDDKNLSVTQQDHKKNLRTMGQIFAQPLSVDETKLTGRVSFRTTSIDHLPLVGPVPDVAAYHSNYKDICHGRVNEEYSAATYLQGLYLTTGHGSRGLVSCFSSATYLTALICGKPITLPRNVLNRLHPARHIIRELKKSR